PIALRWKMDWKKWAVFFIIPAIGLAWPYGSKADLVVQITCIIPILLIVVTRIAPIRLAPAIYALAIAIFVFLMIPLFHVSTTWYTQGFEFGTQKHLMLAAEETINLPAVLRVSYHWPDDPSTPVRLPGLDRKIEFRTFMLIAYGACLVLCGI